jgi:hypothetical protein
MGIAFAKGPAMAGVVLATLPLVALSGAGVATAIARSQAAVNRASAAAATIAGEALAGVRAVAGAGAAGGVVARYDDANATPERVGARTAWMQGATLGLANASFLVRRRTRGGGEGGREGGGKGWGIHRRHGGLAHESRHPPTIRTPATLATHAPPPPPPADPKTAVDAG